MSKQKSKDIQNIEKLSPYIEVLQSGSFSWVDINRTKKSEIGFLQDEFNIEPEDLTDTLPILQRPKITIRENYIFLVLLFPIQLKNNDAIQVGKISFFIFPHITITLHNNNLPAFVGVKDHIESLIDTSQTKSLISPKSLIPNFLIALYDDCLPISNNLANSIDAIESDIFKANIANKKLVKEIYDIERNLVDFRKIMRNHSIIINKLFSTLPEFAEGRISSTLTTELNEYPHMIWSHLDAHMEAIDTLRQTYESLTSYYLNDILKTLTIISILIAPMSVLGAIFGMNFRFIPFASDPNGFLYMLILMLALTLLTFYIFKKKKWF